MTFLESLERYLQSLERAPGQKKARFEIDPAQARSWLIDALDALKAEGREGPGIRGAESPGAQSPGSSPAALLADWQKDDRIARFASRLATLLRESFGYNASPSELETWVAVGIAHKLGLQRDLSSWARTLELRRLASMAYDDVFHESLPVEEMVDRYAAAIRATRPTEGSIALTPIGQVFLFLTGRDAIRWLLQTEALLSTGTKDPWRMSRETAGYLGKGDVFWHREDSIDDLPFSWQTVCRFASIGLLRVEEDEPASTLTVHVFDLGRELFREIAEGVESPLSVVAKTLVGDVAQSAISAVVPGPLAAAATGAEATARQARLVAHEIRNIILPVRAHLNALYREVLLLPPSMALHRRREAIDRGIHEALRFVGQLVEIAALAATPPEPFDPRSALREAAEAAAPGSPGLIESLLPEALPPIVGHRARVVLALVNLLRNAIQHGEGRVSRVRLTAQSVDAAQALLITVEDDGPGVPKEMRRAIFEEGVSLHGGGTGMGLALVREVFEKEMKGLVACEASELGGARFVVRLPTAGSTG